MRSAPQNSQNSHTVGISPVLVGPMLGYEVASTVPEAA
jgi:hypothetical protein